jgi:hypothetical protein
MAASSLQPYTSPVFESAKKSKFDTTPKSPTNALSRATDYYISVRTIETVPINLLSIRLITTNYYPNLKKNFSRMTALQRSTTRF